MALEHVRRKVPWKPRLMTICMFVCPFFVSKPKTPVSERTFVSIFFPRSPRFVLNYLYSHLKLHHRVDNVEQHRKAVGNFPGRHRMMQPAFTTELSLHRKWLIAIRCNIHEGLSDSKVFGISI